MSAFEDLDPHWPEVSALLDEALDLPAAQRLSWLDALEGERAAFKGTLQRLLQTRAAAETDDFLHTLPRFCEPPGAAIDAFAPAVGALVGPYRLIREIGQGGMGAVWLADRADGQLKRQVALKLPRLVWGSSLTERLLRERDILASLEHPHIARLYDAGIDAHGRPYLAMEFVEGKPIDQHARDHALGIEAVLELLLQVAAAVAHAHSRLVIHRDLKPANILVTREGQVRLLDFGIAKLMEGDRTADTALTRAAGRALTLDYASPEQVRGEPLTTASDVYSLAVVGYELLSGQRPYTLARGSAAELEDAIATAVAAPASQAAQAPGRRKALRGDLDAILNKGLKKLPVERYATVDAMAQDIARHLSGHTVVARPDSLTYRLRRFAQRHRRPLLAAAVVTVAFGLGVGAGATALVIAALLVGLGTTTWQARRAREQARRAHTEARTAQAVQDFLEGIFRANSGDQADPVAARQRTAKDLLDEGATRIEHELHEAPLARLRVLQVLAQMYEDLEDLPQAVLLHGRRIALAMQSLGEGSSEELHARSARAGALTYLQQLDEAQAELRRAEAVLAGRTEHTADARIAFFMSGAACHKLLGQAEAGLAKVDQALTLLHQQQPSARHVVALFDRAGLLRIADRMAEVVDTAREALALIAAQPALGASAQTSLHLEMATALQGLGDLTGAERSFRDAMQQADRHHGLHSDIALVARGWMGEFLLDTSRPREAVPILLQVADMLQRRLAAPDAFAGAPALLAHTIDGCVRIGWFDSARSLVERGEVIGADRSQSSGHATLFLVARAALAVECGEFDAAEQGLDQAQALIDEHGFGARDVHRLRYGPLRVHLHASRGEPQRAMQALQIWKAGRARAQDPVEDDLVVLQATAEALLSNDDVAQARHICERALSCLVQHPQRASNGEAEAALLDLLGQACLLQHDLPAAIDSLQQAEAMQQQLYDAEHAPKLARVRVWLAQARLAAGEVIAARQLLQAATAIHARHAQLGPQHTEPLHSLETMLR